MFLKKSTIGIKLISGFATALIVLLLAGWQMYRSLEGYIDTSHWVNHTYQALEALGELTSDIAKVENGHYAFIITGEDFYLTERESEKDRIIKTLENIRRLTIDNPRQQLRIARLEQSVREHLEFLERNIEIFRTQGREVVRDRIKRGISRLSMEALLNQITMIEEEERALLVNRNQKAESDAHWAKSVGLLLTTIAVAGIFLLWLPTRYADRELRNSEAMLQQILDLLPVGVTVCNPIGQITRTNPAMKEIWGGVRYVDIEQYDEYKGWWPDTGQRLTANDWAMARTLKNGETVRDELVNIQGFDGKHKTILNHTMLIHDYAGQMIGGIMVNMDVTGFKRTETELRIAARFDETQGLALELFSSSFNRQQISDDLLALLAEKHPFPVSALYHYDEWSGRYHCEAAHGLAAGMAREFVFGEGLLGEAARSGKTVMLDTRTLSLQAGIADFMPVMVLMIPIVYQGKRLAVLVLAASAPLGSNDHNFLERLAVQIGAALHNLKQYDDLKLLAEKLRNSGEEIAAKNQQLEEASRMKSEFLANMSHELRTPLNAIIGFSEVLKDNLMGELPPQQKSCIVDIFDSGNHLLSLINDILDLSKIEAGKMELELGASSVPALVQASLQVIREKALVHRLQLTTELADDLNEVWLDERKVKQILYNLLSNAVKFTPEGGAVHVIARKVNHTAAQEGQFDHYLELTVRDTGIGIALDDQGRLFQPFVQIDSTLSRRYHGTGLGLVMVRRLTDLHGGTVALHSEPGKGSTFIVQLPWRTEEKAPVLTPEMTPIPNEEPMALVVEDDDMAADLLRVQLEGAGFNVVRAATAESALKLAVEKVPDVITLDILLPGMDGWEFLERIKREPRLAAIPVVIISVLADKNRGISLGAAQVLQKPVAHQELIRALTVFNFEPTDGRQPTALVVDDDPKSVQLLGAYLGHAGYHVVSAYGGQEGIDLVHRQIPDLIVLDLMMPEVNGFDVVEALKGDPTTAIIPIIVLTAKQITTEDRDRLNGDVMRIIEKSDFNHGRFINEVKRALAGKGK